MNELVIFCKVTEEAKVEIELQKERRVEGFQRRVIFVRNQILLLNIARGTTDSEIESVFLSYL